MTLLSQVDELIAGNLVEKARLDSLRAAIVAGQSGAWIWPVKGIRPRITQKFNNPTSYGPHEGTDMDCYDETTGKLCEIVAVSDGVVKAINVWNGTKTGFQAYGHWVLVQHGEYQVRYCHLQKNSIQVSTGESIRVADVIGIGNNSGNSIGSHLHLTCTHPDAPPNYIFAQRCVNPETLLPSVP